MSIKDYIINILGGWTDKEYKTLLLEKQNQSEQIEDYRLELVEAQASKKELEEANKQTNNYVQELKIKMEQEKRERQKAVNDAVLSLACDVHAFAKSLYGLPAEEWCKRVYQHIVHMEEVITASNNNNQK